MKRIALFLAFSFGIGLLSTTVLEAKPHTAAQQLAERLQRLQKRGIMFGH